VGWQPAVMFKDGLDRTVRWYEVHEPWWRPQMWMRRIPIISAVGKREMH
jgi:dTDP-glucose 4,6-dehydratase